MCSACSGSGAPSYAAKQLVDCFKEISASELHDTGRRSQQALGTLGLNPKLDPCQKEPRSQFAIAGAKPNSVTRSPASELRTSALRMQPGSSSRMSTALFVCTKTRRCRIRRLRGVSGYTSGLKLRRSVLGFSRSNFSSSLHVSLDKFRP